MKELNRDKELEIRKSEQIGKIAKTKAAKSKVRDNYPSDSFNLFGHGNRGHYRSASLYDGDGRINLTVSDLGAPNDFNSDHNNLSHRFMSIGSPKTNK